MWRSAPSSLATLAVCPPIREEMRPRADRQAVWGRPPNGGVPETLVPHGRSPRPPRSPRVLGEDRMCPGGPLRQGPPPAFRLRAVLPHANPLVVIHAQLLLCPFDRPGLESRFLRLGHHLLRPQRPIGEHRPEPTLGFFEPGRLCP